MSSADSSQTEQGRTQRPRIARRWRGLRAQMLLWMVLPLTLVLIGVAFTGIYSHEQAMRDLVQERDRALAVLSAGQVQDLLQQRVDALNSLGSAQPFHHRRGEELEALLAEASDLRGLFAGQVALVEESGRLLALYSQPPGWLANTVQLEDLARAVMTQQRAVAVSDAAAGTLLIAVPVRDEGGDAYGALVGPVTLSSLGLEPLLSRVRVGEHGVVYLTGATGQIVAHSLAPAARSSLQGHSGLETAVSAVSPGVTLCRAPDGEQMTLAYAPVDFGGLGWQVIIEQPWNEVIGPVLRYSQFMPLVAALAAVVSLLTLYYGVQAIVRPLQALGQRAERVAWGDFAATSAPVGGVQEIEDLRRALDQMAQRIQSYQRGMHDYIAAITQGQEEERRRLARELHDDTVQTLVALRQQVEMAQRILISEPQRASERLDQVRGMLAEALDGVRRFTRDLRPAYLEDLGFIPALEMLVALADQREALSVQLSISGSRRRLPYDMELAAYRIVQEALNNVVQHAAAHRAWVEVRFQDLELVLGVRDDGVGFEPPGQPDALARQGHFGLMGIQERTLLYGGRLDLRSAPRQGTQITVSLPYQHQA